MSKVVTGTIFKTPCGKFVRTFRAVFGSKEYVQATSDIHCATVFQDGPYKNKSRAEAVKQFGPLAALEVEIIREVKIISEGN